MIEEEREEDERKLSVAIAAAERMNVLVRQKDLLYDAFAGVIMQLDGEKHLISNFK